MGVDRSDDKKLMPSFCEKSFFQKDLSTENQSGDRINRGGVKSKKKFFLNQKHFLCKIFFQKKYSEE